MPARPALPSRKTLLALACALAFSSAHALVPRPAPVAGSIVSSKGDEQLQLVSTTAWVAAETEQQLLGGDTLRTGPYGGLGLLFADRTQVRVQRNSVLTVKQMPQGNAPAQLGLQKGVTWSRAATAGKGLDIETPSATAAIRGTEWSLAVGEDGSTTLIVIEGEVRLHNAQGEVTARRGEIATARIGEAPVKSVLVRPEYRTQYAIHLELDYALWWLPLSGLPAAQQQQRLAALQARPEGARSTEEWAELALLASETGRSTLARDAADRLPAGHPAGALVHGLQAAKDGRVAEADPLLARAADGLDGAPRSAAQAARQLVLIRLQRYAEADALLARSNGDARQQLARAWLQGFQGDLVAAAEGLDAARRQNPQDARLAAMAAEIAVLLGRAPAAEEASRHAIELAPEDPAAWAARGHYLTYLTPRRGDAAEALQRATALAPDWPLPWARLGEVLLRDDRPRAAEAALRRAIQLAPQDGAPRLSLVQLMLKEMRTREAAELLASTPARTPQHAAAQGRLELLLGNTSAALEHYLSAATAEPLLSAAEIGATASYYQQGEVKRAVQGTGNADRLDPNDPTPPLMASVIAADHFRADEAVVQAREALRRIRLQEDGQVSQLASSRDGAMSVGRAFTSLGLDEWAEFYDEQAFSPFDPNSNLARFRRTPNDIIAYFNIASTLDPINIYSRNRYTDFYYQPFTDVSAEASYGRYRLHQPQLFGREDWQESSQVAELRGYMQTPLPTAYVLRGERTDSSTTGSSVERDQGGSAALLHVGSRLTPHTGLFFQGAVDESNHGSSPSFQTLSGQEKSQWASVGLGHRLGDRDLVVGVLSRYASRDNHRYEEPENEYLWAIDQRYRFDTEGDFASLRRLTQYGDVVLSYGLDWARYTADTRSWTARTGELIKSSDEKADMAGADLDLSWSMTPQLKLQGGLSLSRSAWKVEDAGSTEELSETYWSPRAGLAWTPDEQQMLRLSWRRDPPVPLLSSMTPPDTVGLFPEIPHIDLRTRSLMGRWDREWSPHLFSAVEAAGYVLEPLLGDGREGRIERYGLHLNSWLGQGIGLAGGYQRIHHNGDLAGNTLPFVPDYAAYLNARWILPEALTINLSHALIGPSDSASAYQPRVDAYQTTSLALTWEPLDRQVLLSVAVLNLFDQHYGTTDTDPDYGGNGAMSEFYRFVGLPEPYLLLPARGRELMFIGQLRF